MQTRPFLASVAAAMLLAACGGSGDGGNVVRAIGAVTLADGPQIPPPRFSNQVIFGDSTSDVGTYAVGSVANLGGGKFTINGDATVWHPELNGKTWSEMMAPLFGLPAPCAAQTGLAGDPAQGISVPVVNYPGCYGYAQGGARVLDPVGINNAATGSPMGELTVPVTTQVANHLAAAGGRFQGSEIVFVMAGQDEVLALWSQLYAGAVAASQGLDPAAGQQARALYLFNAGPGAISNAAQAGTDLAGVVRDQILAAGANYVVVGNAPDLAGSPFGSAQEPAMRSLVQAMVEAFNRALDLGLAAAPQVARVDVYGLTHDELANPALYGLSNTGGPVCGPNALQGDALFCNVFNTWPGLDASHFMYADWIHYTPYAHWLLARQVAAVMSARGWL